ncbi:YqzH family protein [Fictibacillus sp. b24]|uniref:YqzH family protein n=1 Tax=Fictibacillus sp. b24 TaxID=3055863 RepID=UPI0025A202FE|nr:YqzH family protein [Fictibacillus sp. b24]MDM5316003.1 YqzH family protein [Fictibacillus sp. b24]
MDRSLLRKMIVKALKDYLWEEEDCILTDTEWNELEEKILGQMSEVDQKEAVYTIIQDVVYEFFTNK